AITDAVTIPVIASGGAGSVDDLVPAVLEGRANAVLAASIFHFGDATLAEARTALREAGVPTRR
ncbi:MAG: HisA/HisF-related TIM barrel protein, partial [Pseudomonadota bacterium]